MANELNLDLQENIDWLSWQCIDNGTSHSSLAEKKHSLYTHTWQLKQFSSQAMLRHISLTSFGKMRGCLWRHNYKTSVNPTPNVTLGKRYPGPEWCSCIREYVKETPVDGNFLII